MLRILLIGFMAAGKTTLGKALAKELGLQFIDLDHYIECRYHSTVSQLFADRGEEAFRQIERNMLHEVADFEDVIIACGGGTPCFFDNMEYMNAHGTTVWLNTQLDKLHTRLMRGRHKRPLIADKDDEQLRQFIITALDARRPHYEKAQITFSSDLLDTKSEIDDTVKEFMEKLSLPLDIKPQ